MRPTADAVIIGGGVMGCSILYHLTQQGITDALLVEQDVLGSGSTGRSQTICRMHYSNAITASMAWQSLEVFANFGEIIGGHSGFVRTGYLVAVSPEDVGGLRRNIAMQQELGIDTRLVTAEDLRDLAPMIRTAPGEGLVGVAHRVLEDLGVHDDFFHLERNVLVRLEANGLLEVLLGHLRHAHVADDHRAPGDG